MSQPPATPPRNSTQRSYLSPPSGSTQQGLLSPEVSARKPLFQFDNSRAVPSGSRYFRPASSPVNHLISPRKTPNKTAKRKHNSELILTSPTSSVRPKGRVLFQAAHSTIGSGRDRERHAPLSINPVLANTVFDSMYPVEAKSVEPQVSTPKNVQSSVEKAFENDKVNNVRSLMSDSDSESEFITAAKLTNPFISSNRSSAASKHGKFAIKCFNLKNDPERRLENIKLVCKGRKVAEEEYNKSVKASLDFQESPTRRKNANPFQISGENPFRSIGSLKSEKRGIVGGVHDSNDDYESSSDENTEDLTTTRQKSSLLRSKLVNLQAKSGIKQTIPSNMHRNAESGEENDIDSEAETDHEDLQDLQFFYQRAANDRATRELSE